MASSGSSGRPNSKGFEFVSDDILCSYDDFGAPDGANGNHSEPAIGVAQAKDFHKIRMARPATYPIYSPQEDSFSQDVISAVDKTMKKYADNLLRFLEGISSRMSQLELYCYNVDKSIGEMRSDLVRDHEEADTRLKSLEKHLQEVHRSVRILRDKQELAETQKELAKLQLVQKESSSSSHAPQNEERPAMPSGDSKRTDNASEINNQQLALALPRQVTQQPPLSQDPQAALPQNMPQQQSYYLPPASIPNPQHTPSPYMPSDPPRYQTPSLQDISSGTRVAQQPSQPLASQAPVVHSFPQYAQQWPPQMRPPPTSTAVYTYPTQPANPSPSETLPSSLPLQMSFSGVAQPGSSRAEALPYGYGGAGRVVPQPPQHAKGAAFGGAQPGDGYPAPPAPRPHAALPPGSAYMIYDAEGARGPHHGQQSPFPGGGYMLRNQSPPQFVRNNPYTELIDKLANMGYMGSHVVDVIQRMEESGQQVDFNSVLDRLNGHSSSSSQRGGW